MSWWETPVVPASVAQEPCPPLWLAEKERPVRGGVALQRDSSTLEMGGRRLSICLRRGSRSPSDCLGALLSGAWLVNCLESGVVEGAVSKTAPRSRMLISGGAWAPTTSWPHRPRRGQEPRLHLAQESWAALLLTHLGSAGPPPVYLAGASACS